MSRASRETLRRVAAEKRDDARAETRVALGEHAARYRGHTPHTIDGRPTFAARVGGFQNKSRRGRTERKRDGGMRFVPFLDAEPKERIEPRSYGENIGDALVADTQPSLVNRPASIPRPEGS
jgi:hypothetical protein